MRIRVLEYRCTNPKCKTTDHPKFAEHEHALPAIACNTCGNGQHLKMEDMMNQKRGMLPVTNPDGSLLIVEEYEAARL